MQSPRSRHIQKLYIGILRGVIFLRRMIKDHRIKFQAFCVLHRKDHHAASKLRRFRISLGNRNLFSQLPAYFPCLLLIPADNRNGLIACLLPGPYGFFRFKKHVLLIQTRGHGYRVSMPVNGFHRIDRKIPMPQNIRSKFRDFHRIPVTFFQKTEAVVISL